MSIADKQKQLQELQRRQLESGTLTSATESYRATSTQTSSGSSIAEKEKQLNNVLSGLAADGSLRNIVYGNNYGKGFVEAEERYNGFVSRLESYLNDYGKDYGKNKSNRGMFVRSLQDIDGISADIRTMLDELDDYDLYDETKSSFKDALNELLKATDSASLDARSRISAYNNPATQRIMQQEDEQLYSQMLNEKLQNSPQMALYNSMLDTMGGNDIGNTSSLAPYAWQLEESPVRQDQLLGELTQRYSNIANQYPHGTDTRDKYLGLATDTQNTRDQLSAYRSAQVAAMEDEQLNREIERLKAIDIDTAINSVKQTIDELDAQAQSMKKYWDEQAYLNDDSGSAPDYAEYEKLLEERAKYESILDDLYNDEDSDEMSGYTWVDDSIVRSHLSENFNATRLYDRVNAGLFGNPYDEETMLPEVEFTPNEGVKTSSYPIAQRPEDYMTQEERDTFNKLWHYKSEEAATAYFERLTPTLEARGAQQVMAEAKQFTEDYPNWAWVQARGANAMKPITSAFMIGDILSGNGIRENSAANLNTSAANFVDSYVPQVTNYTGDAQILGRDLDQFLYGTAGSVIDSGVRTLTASVLSGGGTGATLRENIKGLSRATGALMSLEVFPTVVLQEKEKGRSDAEAVVLGTLRAAIEGFTEKYSIEMLFSPSRNFGAQLLKGAVAEGSEEIAANILNGAVDIIAGDKDNIIAEWDRRTAMGINPTEALADILLERGKDTLVDGLSGTLSGLIFTAGGGISGAMTPTTKSAERMAQSVEVTEALVQQALAENPNNRVALKAQEDLAAGKTISAKTVQKLIESNESVYRKDDQQTIASFVASELTNRGEVTAVNETANAIAKAVVGENLSDGDLRAIESSAFGKQLYNEVTGQTKGGEWLNQLRDNLDVVEIARPQIQRETKPTAAKRVTVKNADATTKDGTAVQIVGLEAQTDGTTKVKVKGSDGAVKAMAASELELNEISKDLIEGVAKFKGAAPAIYAAYMPTNDVGTYLNDVEYIVTAANGVAADNDGSTILDYLKNSKHISDLADVQIETIFNAALAEGRKALAEAQPLSTSGSGQFTYTAKRAESSIKGREAASTVFMQALVKVAPNIDIEVFESTARMGKYIGEQGSYSDGKIRIDLNAGKNFTYDVAESAMLRTLSHELTHHLQRTAPKQYADLKAFVIKHLAEWNGGTELDDLISAKQRRSGGNLSYAAALDEVVADSCEMMLKNSAAVKQLAVENKRLFSKIRDFVKKFLSDLRRAFAGVEATDVAAKYLQKFETEMQQLWDAAFTASVENAKTATSGKAQKNTAPEGTQFSDRDYAAAVRSDNVEKMSQMVDAAANAALAESQARVNGKLAHLFHGSETFGFTEFDPARSENALFFSDNIEVSAEYNNGKAVPQRIGKPFVAQKSYSQKDLTAIADRYREYMGIQIKELTVDAKAGDRAVHLVTHAGIDQYYSAAEFDKLVWGIDKAYERGSGIYEVVLDMKNPLIIDAKYNNWDSVPFEGKTRTTRQLVKSARIRGYDGVIFKNIHDVAGTNDVNPAYFSTVYAVFKPNQVFSADPVTYDNNGNVIPLSERFNPENNDIRYSDRDSTGRGRGYIGKSMSVNARDAYGAGEKPLSNWSKADILDEARFSFGSNADFEKLGLDRLTTTELKENLLARTAWHHTGAFYSQTNFYSLDEAYLMTLTREDVDNIVANRGKTYKTEADRAAAIADKKNLRVAQATYRKIELILASGIAKQKTIGGLVRAWMSGSIGENTYRDALAALDAKYAKKVSAWEKLPPDHARHDDVAAYKANKELAILNEYTSNSTSNKYIQALKRDAAIATADPDTRYSERDYEAAEIADLENEIAVLERRLGETMSANSGLTESVKGRLQTLERSTKLTQTALRKRTEELGRLQKRYENENRASERYRLDEVISGKQKEIDRLTRKLESNASQLRDLQSTASMSRDEISAQLLEARQKLAEHKKSYREGIAAYRVGRNKAAVISSIKRLETNLHNQLLGKGGKGAYVPVNLVNSVIGVAQILDTSGSPTYKRNGEVHESQTFKKYASVKEALLDLQDQYNQLPQNPDPEYAQEYTSEFASMLTDLRNAIGDKNVHDMTLEQLQDVHALLRQLTYTLIDAKKQIGKVEAKTNYEIGMEIMGEMKAVQGKDGGVFRQMGNTAALEVMSPLRNVNRMTGYVENSALVEVFSDLNDGIKRQNAFIMDANKLFDPLRDGDNAKKFANAVNQRVSFGIKDVNGNDANMTMMQAMQILLSHEREVKNGKTQHLDKGGIIIPDAKLLQKGKVQDAILKGTIIPSITVQDVNVLRKAIAEYENGWGTEFLNASRFFFNHMAKDAINDVSMVLQHRLIATDDSYIPFSVDKGTVSKEIEGLKYDSTIEGSGILKSVTPNAANALIIAGLNSVIEQHITDVAKVYGLAIPIRNFNKVWNVKQIGSQMTTKKAVGYAWGAEGQKLIEQAITDLQTSREHPRDFFSRALGAMQSNFVKATLLSNISVTIKQAASYSVAGLHLSQRALAPYQTTVVRLFATPGGKFAQDLFNEIDTYTPEHWIRRQGMSSQEIGDYYQKQGKLAELDRKTPTALNPIKWIQNMDVATTAALWLAAKKQVEIDGKTEIGSDAYWTAVTQLYERVIEETQPMYDVLHRPEVQKTTNALVRNLIMFKTQPIQNSGILYDAFGEMVAARNGENKTRARAATKKFYRAVFSQVASLAVFATMSLVAYAVRHKIGRYRNDEDEVTLGSVLWRIAQDMMSNASGLILPIGGIELYDFIDRRIGGSSYFDSISVPTVQMLNEFLDAFGNVIDVFKKENADDWERAVWEFVERTAAISAGIPLQNIANIFEGVRLSIKDIKEGAFPVFNNTNVDRENSTNYDRLWNAIVDGDAAKYGEVYDEVYTNLTTKDEKTNRDAVAAIESGITERVKSAFYAGEISEEAARKYLSEYGGKQEDDVNSYILKWRLAVETGMEYSDLSDEFVMGNISADEFKQYLMNYGGASEEDAAAIVQRSLMEKETGIAYDDLKPEFLEGKISDADAREYLSEYGGKSETSIDKTLSEWAFEKAHGIPYGDMKEAYINGEMTRSEAVVYRMEYGGQDEADAEAAVAKWAFEKEHGYAYDDMREEFVSGNLSEEDAIAYRVEYGGQDEDDAAKTVSEWKLEREADIEYDDLHDAFISGNITEDQAIEYRMEYGGQSKSDASAEVQKWKMQVDTGIAFDDLKQAFLDGEVSEAEAIEYRKTYGGQSTKAARNTVADWKFEQATGLPQSELKDAFVDGEFTAAEAIGMLTDYAGKSEGEAEAAVTEWQMLIDTGHEYADIHELYIDGTISKSDVISYGQKYGGKTAEEAQETADAYEFEKTHGWAYKDRASLYADGDITASELRSALIEYGGETAEDADLQIKVYDLEAQGYEYVTTSRVRDYDEFCASESVPYDIYFDLCYFKSNTKNDVDENGDISYYSAVEKVMAEIDSTTLTSAQKTAVAMTFWQASTVYKYRLW